MVGLCDGAFGPLQSRDGLQTSVTDDWIPGLCSTRHQASAPWPLAKWACATPLRLTLRSVYPQAGL